MRLPGGWRSPRISARGITAASAVLGLVFALVAIVDLATADRRVVLVDTRSIESVTPPFIYEHDQRRFMRLVVLPLCPGDPEPLVAIGRTCRETANGVQVEVRDGLVAGEDGEPVAATELKAGLEVNQDDLGKYADITAEGKTLSITWREEQGQPNVPPSLLVQLLRAQPAVVAPKGQPEPVGTGPFYVAELWCRGKREKVQCSRTGGPPPIPLGNLDDWLEGGLVLRRREWFGTATTEIVVVSLRGQEDGKNESSSLEPRDKALVQALDRGQVHAVFDVEADLEAGLKKASEGSPKGWRFTEPRQDRVLVAALHPPDSERSEVHLPEGCRSPLVHALAKIRQDPTFLRELGARPADQLLPEPFEPMHTWQEPAVKSADSCSGEIDLVTNAAWEYAADAIKRRLSDLEPQLTVNVRPRPTAEEGERRKKGDYGISLLALVYQPRPGAFFLWGNLDGTGWATKDHVQEAADLATLEAKEEQPKEAIYAEMDQLHRELDAYLIPMGAPTRVMAASDRLLGLDPGSWYLDPEDLRLAPSASRFLVRSLLLFASVVLLSLAATTHVFRKESDRRTRVEMSLRMLRHDLLAPLATIRAYAERILTREPKIAEALLSEAEAALAAAEDARFVVREGKLQAHGRASTRLRDEVVEPILDSLRRRSSYEAAQEPTITLDLPDDPPPVSVPPEVAKFVIRTLVENAWRHRGNRPLVLELVGTVSGGFFQVAVKDCGPGMTAGDAAQVFVPGYRSETARREFLVGSGMGLHLARSVLRLHGGEINLLRPANPTIFTIRFPLASKGRGKPAESPEKETP